MLVAVTACKALHQQGVLYKKISGETKGKLCECIEYDLSDLQPKAGHFGM